MSRARLIGAICLNWFLGPGTGHFLMKKKARGTMYVALTLVLLVVFAIHLALIMQAQMININAIGSDPTQLLQFATEVSTDIFKKNDLILRVYSFLLGVCYIAGTADLFLIYYDNQE